MKYKALATEKMKNPKEAFKNEDGAIDLASIMVGIIVIGLIGGVIAATVFAVIPWTQDNAAKQQLDSVVAAESAYMGLASSVPPGTPAGHTANSYADSVKLAEANLLTEGASYCAVTTDAGKGYAAYSQADSGKIWSVTSANTKPVIFTGTLPTDCQFITASTSGSGAAPVAPSTFSALTITAQNGSPTANHGESHYYDIAASADNSVILAGSNGGYVFKSTDNGVTWNPLTSLGTGIWQGIGISADGTRIVIAHWNGNVRQSVDGGATWNALSMPVTNVPWRDVEMSPDGKHIVTGVEGGRMYYSHDFGATWGTVPQTNSTWKSFAISDDGQTIIGASPFQTQLYITRDGGATWGWTAPAIGGNAYYGVSVSADGQTILGGLGSSSGLQVSTDGGATWKMSAGVNADTFVGTEMSNDGSKMVAVGNNGSNTNAVYTSIDKGATWQQQNVGGTGQWYAVSMSSDGSKFAFTSNLGSKKIHTGEWK